MQVADTTTTEPSSAGLKRKRAFVLEDMSANITPTRSGKARRLNNESEPNSLRAQDGGDISGLSDHEQEQEREGEGENEPTPKPAAHTRTRKTSIPTPSTAKHSVRLSSIASGSLLSTSNANAAPGVGSASDHSESSNPGSTSTTSTSSKRKRDGSPVKSVVNEQYAQHYVTVQDADHINKLQPAVQHLFREMRSISKGRNVLHRRYAGWKTDLSAGDDEEDSAILTSSPEQDQRRDSLGAVLDLNQAQRLLASARLNYSHASSEAQWNSSVHARLLLDAIHYSPHQSLGCENV